MSRTNGQLVVTTNDGPDPRTLPQTFEPDGDEHWAEVDGVRYELPQDLDALNQRLYGTQEEPDE